MENIVKILPTPFIELLNKWRNTKITQQFDIEICELSVSIPDCINDFRWKPLPTPTQEYKKWRFMNKEEKEELIKTRYNFYVTNIKNFGDEVEIMKNHNSRNKAQLQEWLKLEISLEARGIIEPILDTYSGQ